MIYRAGWLAGVVASPNHTDMSRAARIARFGAVSTTLALLSDRRLQELVDEAPLIGSGIGGTAVLLQVDGAPIFVKRVPLTDRERRPDNVMSTANVFQLPTFYQYGIGSTGFGVWREVAAHVMSTNWVLDGQSECFPMMYHHRVLAAPPPRARTPDERVELERTVAFWDSSSAVRDRLEALAQSSASVALFLEYIPQNLHEWLTVQVTGGSDAVESACELVERCLEADASFMSSRGFLHFDAHFRNILTDGRRLYFADLGLATSRRFELSEAETAFLERNFSHDRCHTVTQWVNWLVTALCGAVDRDGFIRRCAEGARPVNVPAPAAAIIKRHAEVAVVMNDFYRHLKLERRTVLYPLEEIERVCSRIGSSGPDRPPNPPIAGGG